MNREAQPPKAAKWLLLQFGCSPNNDAVIGDLDERYRTGRHSATWYWRQVFIAGVVGIYTQIRLGRDTYMKQAAKWAFIIVGMFSIGFWTGRSPLIHPPTLSQKEMSLPQRDVPEVDRLKVVQFLQMELDKATVDYIRDKSLQSQQHVADLQAKLTMAKKAKELDNGRRFETR